MLFNCQNVSRLVSKFETVVNRNCLIPEFVGLKIEKAALLK